MKIKVNYFISPARSEKRCNVCGEEQSLDFFRVRKHTRNYGMGIYYYFGSTCLFCKRKRDNEYREKNAEEINKKKREYRKNNLKRVRAQELESRKKYRKEIAARARKYYYNNIEKIKEYVSSERMRQVRIENERKRRIKTDNKKNIDVASDYTFVLKAVAVGFGNECPICGERVIGKKIWHLDHCIPLSRGGQHMKNNIFFCCNKCNQSKYTKTLEEYIGLSLNGLVDAHIQRKWNYKGDI